MDRVNRVRVRDDLIKKYGPPTELTNGIVLQFYKDTAKLPSLTSATWLLSWIGKELCTPLYIRALRSKIRRVAEKATKFRGLTLDTFKEETFTLPESSQPAAFSESVPPPPSSQNVGPMFTSSALTSTPTRPKLINTPEKKLNKRQHELTRKERRISILDRKLQSLNKSIVKKVESLTHFSVKNVKRREERNVQIRMTLRKEKNKFAVRAKKFENENEILKKQLKEVKVRNAKLERKICSQRMKLKRLTKEKKKTERRAKNMQMRNAKKGDSETGLKVAMIEKDKEKRVVDMKKKDGGFTDETRFCVIELTGLEVATGKIGPVIETVGELCGVKFSSLPSRTACQNMVDEGQVLAKAFIREKVLKRSTSFGVHKDGTTRKKVKILDTSVTTDTGEAFCLGWSSVVSETGHAIAEETKEKIQEVVGESDEGFMLEILGKLTYFMNDRAANEKKSSKLLEEWRNTMLGSYGEGYNKKVHHLYCAAHVLLGFHTYTINAVKMLDFLPCGDFKHPVVVLLKDAADIFGPVGDYRGLKNQWEAFCFEKKIKSCIKSYKDNRFNGLFEVAAQVFHHHQDFLLILESQPSRNAKQNRLHKSLLHSDLMILVECLGLFFHFITGPFWTMVISSKVSYQDFRTAITKLADSLQRCSDDPSFFFKPESFSFFNYESTSPETKVKLAKSISNEKMKKIMSCISDGILKTINVQLKDVLEESSSEVTIQAPLTNLVCERHFGHLDSSQRRRPHSSLHHHSSVILLKQTRKHLRRWYEDLTTEEKGRSWKRVRKESRELRKKHQIRDQKAVTESLKLKICQEDEIENEIVELTQGQMVAVACEDAWYPALIERCPEGQDIVVNFSGLGKALGSFYWPTGKDIHTVSRRSVVETSVGFEPRAGGRYWIVTNAKDIQEKFRKFK